MTELADLWVPIAQQFCLDKRKSLLSEDQFHERQDKFSYRHTYQYIWRAGDAKLHIDTVFAAFRRYFNQYPHYTVEAVYFDWHTIQQGSLRGVEMKYYEFRGHGYVGVGTTHQSVVNSVIRPRDFYDDDMKLLTQ